VLTPVAETVRADLRADPYLRWILLLGVATAGAFVWYRLPNFAAPDEYARVLKPMKVTGRAASEGPAGIRRALLADRALGPTVYLFGLSLAPVFVVVVLAGQVGQFTGLGSITSRWELWQEAPAWFWTASILSSRLWSVACTVAAVYVVYRTGVAAYGRVAGRYAATLFALSGTVIAASHEAAEDAPLVLLVALVVYLSVRYTWTGSRREFLAACLLGGLATAFKFSGGITAVVVGAAYLVYVTRAEDAPAVDARLLAGGLAAALAAFYLGFAAAVVGGPGVLSDRVLNEFTRHIGGGGGEGPAPPFFGFGLLRASLNGMGLALFCAVVAGTAARLAHLGRERSDAVPELVVGPAFALFAGVFLLAGDPATRHLLPGYPMALLFTGGAMAAWHERGGRATQVLLAAVVVLTAVYGAGTVLAFAQEPRDGAARTVATQTDPGAEMLVYENSVADVGAVHGRSIQRYEFDEANATGPLVRNETAYTEWMVGSPGRGPALIQVTCSGAVSYLEPDEAERYPERAAFVGDLLFEDAYDYRVLDRAGTAPRTYLDRQSSHPVRRLFEAGLRPNPDNVEPCVVVLEHTG